MSTTNQDDVRDAVSAIADAGPMFLKLIEDSPDGENTTMLLLNAILTATVASASASLLTLEQLQKDAAAQKLQQT